jgi:hypothetical protein
VAKIPYKGDWIRADVFRLTSSKPAYDFQFCYHHKTKKMEVMMWRGQYNTGNYTDYCIIPPSEHEHWKRRIKAGEAKPELQRASEYSMQISRCPEDVINYLDRLDKAQEWDKGQRVRA